MAGAVYVLSAATCLACAVLLLRGYRQGRQRLLLWSGLCFIGLTLDNVTLFMDLIVFPEKDLSLIRLSAALTGLCLLLFGMIWDAQ
jgi:hypothetical protein